MTKYEARLRDYGMLDSELSSVLADIDDEMAEWKGFLTVRTRNLAKKLKKANKANRELEAQVAKLRKIISRCAAAVGASVPDNSTIEFMEMLPGEIRAEIGAQE